MKKIDITPLANSDIAMTKEWLENKFGESSAKKTIGAIYDDLEKLAVYPQMGIDLFSRYGIETDYLCLITHKNYAFLQRIL